MPDAPRQNLFVWAAAVLLVVAVGYRLLVDREPAPPPVELNGAEAAGGAGRPGAARSRRLYVHVAGAVRRPGLYRIPDGARTAAAIHRAGGPRRRADLTSVNLAAKVEDGQQIIVPVRGRLIAAGTAPGIPTTPTAAPGGEATISLATATQAQLEELDGIGPTLAQAILEYRDQNGGFRSIEELQEVSGIGEVRYEALRESVRP